ncbi:alpha/beta hydrolase [Streptomyces sp. ISL-44]|uniref:alpha/beta fold hydrolase n=1 Tax=Streptomyces sp. ISL-44 TaxID=2819184 RepID=UPI001BED0ABF|nr:alpha/beta hydrolase [Streptomyces sp. ISL-44]MBT2540390.1 alpha/beta hydrolase [Streptomyces sp. ISL-44]
MTTRFGNTRYGNGVGRFVRVDGVPLHVVTEGRGPVVVLSAGLAMAWFDWDEVAALLVARGRTVVRFDRPGHGLSGPATAPATAAGEAHRIAGLLDALGLTDPVTVVGHSIAGFHAEAFARLHPERTAALVLVDSSVEEAPRTLLPAALRTAAARALGRAVTAAGLPAALGPAARRATVRASRTGGGDRPLPSAGGPPAARDLVRRCYRTGRVWRGALLENAGYPDTAAEVLALRGTHPLTAPATVLAAHDGSGGRRALRWPARQADLADRLGARFELVEPAGHLVMLDRPDQVARAVLHA